VGSYVTPMKPLATNSWVKVPFNTINTQVGKTINKVGDSILLKPGVYKIKGSVAISLFYFNGMTGGSFTSRFRNLSQNNTILLGKNLLNTTSNASNISLTENGWSDIEGIIVVNNLDYFSLQCFLNRFGSGGASNDIGISDISISGEPALQSYLIIEKIK
jgi:hypothetical protein